MIQRIQTIYMLVALVMCIICLSLPVGAFVPRVMGDTLEMYNLWIRIGNGAYDFSVWGLFAILLIACPFIIFAIFMYKNRRLQARLCTFSGLLLVGWYAVYAFFAFSLANGFNSDFAVRFPAALPLVSLILLVLARKAILADEALVRAADRIR